MLNRSKLYHAGLLLAWTAALALFRAPLDAWVRLSLNDRRYSHLVVIPLISACLLYWKRKKIFHDERWCPRFGLPLLGLGAALFGASRLSGLGPSGGLSLAMFAMVVMWAAGFVLCYGARPFQAARFPILVLLLMVPVPEALMEKIILVLQAGSADVSYAFFRLAGIPVFREGVRFELPVIGVQVAEECSSIHSACALFITGLLVGHFFLRSFWPKFCLSLLTVPIAVFTNAIRIFTIWWLAVHVDMGFMYGDLHRNGGMLFSLISLFILLAFLVLLRKVEHRSPSLRRAGEGAAVIAAG